MEIQRCRCRCWKVQRVERSGAIVPGDHVLILKILHRATKGVKLNEIGIIGSETTNINKILNQVRCKKNIMKMKRTREVGDTGGRDRKEGFIADHNGWIPGRSSIGESTRIGGHVGGGARVQVPLMLLWLLERHGGEAVGEAL